MKLGWSIQSCIVNPHQLFMDIKVVPTCHFVGTGSWTKTFSISNLGKVPLKKAPVYYKWAWFSTADPARAFFRPFFRPFFRLFFFFFHNAPFSKLEIFDFIYWLNFWTGWPQFKSVETLPRIIFRITFTKKAPQLSYGTLKKFRPRFRKTQIERYLIELTTLV